MLLNPMEFMKRKGGQIGIQALRPNRTTVFLPRENKLPLIRSTKAVIRFMYYQRGKKKRKIKSNVVVHAQPRKEQWYKTPRDTMRSLGHSWVAVMLTVISHNEGRIDRRKSQFHYLSRSQRERGEY